MTVGGIVDVLDAAEDSKNQLGAFDSRNALKKTYFAGSQPMYCSLKAFKAPSTASDCPSSVASPQPTICTADDQSCVLGPSKVDTECTHAVASLDADKEPSGFDSEVFNFGDGIAFGKAETVLEKFSVLSRCCSHIVK